VNIIELLFGLIVYAVTFAALLYTVYRVVKSDLTKKQKIFWIVIILLFPYGALGCVPYWIFYIVRRTRREYGTKSEEKEREEKNTYIPTYYEPSEYRVKGTETESDYNAEYEAPAAATECNDTENVKGDSENSENGKIPV